MSPYISDVDVETLRRAAKKLERTMAERDQLRAQLAEARAGLGAAEQNLKVLTANSEVLFAERDALKTKVEELERKDIALAAGIDEMANSRARAWIETAALRSALLVVAETQKCAKDGLPCWCADGDHDNCAEACSAARAALHLLPQSPAHVHVWEADGRCGFGACLARATDRASPAPEGSK